ncbi:MAG TPA: phosphatidylserine/phosphatidylglycerophosphate/cardiolipin synthase family protein [Rectinemataceae bacterium]|nr:phosphatidylserine/phosphatidylglycerophosphate/cardiolipin synthase family protein [Rectinemataceae bacterium]
MFPKLPSKTRFPVAALALILALSPILTLHSCASAPAPEPKTKLEKKVQRFFADRDIPELPSTAPKLYFSSDAWMARALELVESAKDYIMIDSFLVNAHPVNSAIMEALVKKSRAGVRVYLIFDSSSYFTYMPDMVSFLPTALKYFAGTPVRVAEYNPMTGLKLFSLPSLLDRDHRKFWIVDGKYLAVGGMNLNYYSLAPSGEYSNIDTFAEIEGPEPLALMVESFCDTWNRNAPEPIEPDSFAIPENRADSSVWLVDQAPGGGSKVSSLFDAFFLCAEKEIWMVQAYTFTTPELTRKIRTATRRGVEVHLILSANSFRTAYDEASKYCVQDLLEAGAKVYMFDAPDNSFLHYKLMFADGYLAAFGSPNFNYRSQYLSREIALVSADPEVGAKTLLNLQGIMKYATPIPMEEASLYRSAKYLASYLGMLFGG